MATTFINKNCEKSTLLDLKHLLIAAKQKLPPELAALESKTPLLNGGDYQGCSYCGKLGHRITDCPKLQAVQNKQVFLARRSAD